jgi:hypothetical protein
MEDPTWRAAAHEVLEQFRVLECASEFFEPVQLDFDVSAHRSAFMLPLDALLQLNA